MDAANWNKLKILFNQAINLSAAERAPFLETCDENLRNQISKLIESHENAGEFIAEPALVEIGFVDQSDANIGRRIDDYEILEEIGRGGMGAVYLAKHLGDSFTQTVAVKLIKRGMDTAAVLKRFVMERQILANLEHPNIARLLDVGTTTDGLPYFVMEYIEGLPVTKFCDLRELSINERLELFQKICASVQYAHQNLVVHRDIKPSNILVTEDGTPKLLDFGIAKLLNPDWSPDTNEHTATMGKLFTPEYASPEQIRGDKITTASDVYSLGVVLYELLSGQRPFKIRTESREKFIEEILIEEPIRPSECGVRNVEREMSEGHFETDENENLKTSKNSAFHISHSALRTLKGDLDNIILKALRKEPAERYNSVQQFSEDIARFLKGLPVLARPQTFSYRFGKYFKRHKVGVAAAALVLFSMIGGSSVAAWQSFVAKRERDRANARFEKLRETAKLLMNETRDTLDYLPGTIKLRQSLSEKSVDLLDSFYEDNSTDPDFLKELADSYEKLGKTQLWEFRQLNFAQKNIEKSVGIRKEVIRLEPQTIRRKIELSKSLSSLAEAIYFQRKTELLKAVRDETETLLREIVENDPTDENLSNLAQHLTGFVGGYKEFHLIGENEKSLGEASAIFQKIIEKNQNEPLTAQAKTELAWNLICQGGIFKYLNQDDAALERFGQAAKLAETAYNSDNTLQAAFNYNGFAHRTAGEVHERRGDFQKAFEMYRYSFDWLKIREKNEAQSKPNLAWASSNAANRCALMLHKLGREKEAREIIVKPWKDYSSFLEQETNAASVVYEQEPLQFLANYFSASNRIEEAVEIWRQHSARIQEFLDKNPDDVDFILQKVRAENAAGDVYAAYDEQSDLFKTTDKKRLAKAINSYQTALEFCRKSQKLYSPTDTEKKAFQNLEAKIQRLKE